MLVKELIEELQTLPQDKEIYILGHLSSIEPIEFVGHLDEHNTFRAKIYKDIYVISEFDEDQILEAKEQNTQL